MRFIYVGLIAISIALLLNPIIEKIFGVKVVFWGIPLVEEGIKTLAAVYFQAALIGTHFVFGVVEGAYDLLRPTKTGRWSGLLSVMGHTLFGVVTWLLLQYGWPLYLAVMVSGFMHSLWNMMMMIIWL